MVIGHNTWWSLNLAEQTNVMLDIKPASGHRVLIQSYPGGIESGTDWYQNDAGVVLTETTINQTPFNARGTPVAFRARMAIQYSDNIDDVVRILSTQNNGLYTNEWIMGDAKTNEVAIFDLGTKPHQAMAQLEERMVRWHSGILLGGQQRQRPYSPARRLSRSQQRSGLYPLCPGGARYGLAGALSEVSWPNR
jgi:hypothetical protein